MIEAPAGEEKAARWLLSAQAVRTQAQSLLEAARTGDLTHFQVRTERLNDTARHVAEVIKQRYPDLQIPYHARWRHFVIDGEDQWQMIADSLDIDALDLARIRIELAVISVLLDAGAGEQWSFFDETTQRYFGRSEGLALASLDGFLSGAFTTNPNQPLGTDTAALQVITPSRLGHIFQVRQDNPLAGLEGRAKLLNRLGTEIALKPEFFGMQQPRLGHLADYFLSQAKDGTLAAPKILDTILQAFSGIWPAHQRLAGINLGDCWRHPLAGTDGPAPGYVPFHKLSQWLSYSLVEPLEELGLKITDLDGLTGLAEYRNGGLMLDRGLLELRNPDAGQMRHEPGSALIVEWRALTIALLDLVAEEVRELLGTTSNDMPLASVLEGGTWAAGRQIAHEKRQDGAPPLQIVSDGSVF